MKLQYCSSPDSPRFGNEEAAKVADQLIAIEKSQGVITPKALVVIASKPTHYLHRYFEWNDAAAADRYRTWQARQLIASVFVVTEDNGKATTPVRAFVNVHTSSMDSEEEGATEPAYVSLSQTIGRSDYSSQVLQYAADQLKSWRRRFGNFQKFYAITSEIDKL